MLVGVGIDLGCIRRIGSWLDRFSRRELTTIFSAGEIDAACAAADSRGALAARFSAKEATAKALGIGIGSISWRDIEVRLAREALTIALRGPAADIAAAKRIGRWTGAWVQIDDLVLTQVTAERGPSPPQLAPIIAVRRTQLGTRTKTMRLAKRLFLREELIAIRARRNFDSSIAARWCAKSAASSILGLRTEHCWTGIHVRLCATGAPYLTLSGAPRERAQRLGLGPLHVSLSHQGSSAAAMVAVTAGRDC